MTKQSMTIHINKEGRWIDTYFKYEKCFVLISQINPWGKSGRQIGRKMASFDDCALNMKFTLSILGALQVYCSYAPFATKFRPQTTTWGGRCISQVNQRFDLIIFPICLKTVFPIRISFNFSNFKSGAKIRRSTFSQFWKSIFMA